MLDFGNIIRHYLFNGLPMKKRLTILLAAVTNYFCTTLNSQAQPYLDSAQQLINKHQYQLALESAATAQSIDAKDYRGYYLQAQVYQQLKNISGADKEYQQALALAPSDYQLLADYAGFLCTNNNFALAKNYYLSALHVAVKNKIATSNLYINYGDCLTVHNQLELATTSYLEALRSESAPLSAYTGISYAYLLENNPAKAYYYISLYHGNETADTLNIKIMSVQRLLMAQNSSLLPENKKNLQLSLEKYQDQLQQINLSATSSSSNDMATVKPKMAAGNSQMVSPEVKSTRATTTAVAILTKAPAAKAVTTEYPPLTSRVKTSSSRRKYVTVIKGDTLFNLALRSNNSAEKLRTLNKMSDNNVRLGEIIYLD